VDGQSFTLKEAIVHAQQAVRSFQALRLDKNKPVPAGPWQSALTLVNQLMEQSAALLALVTTTKVEGRPLTIASGSAINVQADGQAVSNFTTVAASLVAAADALIQNVATIFTAIRASDLAKNGQEATLITDDAKVAANAAIQAGVASEAAVATAASLDILLSQAKASEATENTRIAVAQSTIATAQTEAASRLSEIRTSAATAQENAAVIASRLTDVTALKSQMESSNSALTAFNANLSSTQERVERAEKGAASVLNDFEAKRDEIARMLSDAEHMLTASTVAGLATAFDKERSGLEKSLFWAQAWFVAGIVMLTITTVPLLLYVSNIQVNATTKGLLSVGNTNYELTLAGVISRGIVILGPFWLTLFSARRYRSLFELRQQYSHKYNMAFSMEGFKKQAPQYSENIAAWVFSIVAASPVQQKQGGAMDEVPSTSFKDFGEIVTGQFRKLLGLHESP
jgi:hypothetical protein